MRKRSPAMSEPDPARRDLIKLIGGAPFLSLMLGCATASRPPVWKGASRGALIDVHCHLFNASDLPTVRFLKVVFLEMYPRQAVSVLDVRNPDVVDGILSLLTWVLGRTNTPSAQKEIDVLDGRLLETKASTIAAEQARAIQKAVADFIVGQSGALSTASSSHDRGNALIVDALSQAAGDKGPIAATGRPSIGSATATAKKAYQSKTDLGTYLRWFGLITHYRYALADQLQDDHARQGFDAKLLVPALVDYDKWLGEDVTTSPLPRQVDVVDFISQRPDGPMVHGYVAFDPLRQAYRDAKVEDTGFDPLDLVRTAIKDSGFLGVKLYPPMGFKPIANGAVEQSYPTTVKDKLHGRVGPALDNALTKLYDLCTRMDAPILAHANRSNGASTDAADRADPAFWLPVFDRWPTLRVCLAHFGRFSSPSAAAQGTTMPEASWEWTLGQYIGAHPDRPVYADISFLSEIFGQPEVLQRTAAYVRKFVGMFDKDVRHLMFGTDWIMLGLDGGYPDYTTLIHDFFSGACGFLPEQMDRLMHGNAERFLGLSRGSQTWSRLTAYYSKNNLPLGRLQSIRGATMQKGNGK